MLLNYIGQIGFLDVQAEGEPTKKLRKLGQTFIDSTNIVRLP